MEILEKRAEKIFDKLTDVIAQTEKMKLDHGITLRTVRQWKDVRSSYLSLVQEMEKLTREIKATFTLRTIFGTIRKK